MYGNCTYLYSCPGLAPQISFITGSNLLISVTTTLKFKPRRSNQIFFKDIYYCHAITRTIAKVLRLTTAHAQGDNDDDDDDDDDDAISFPEPAKLLTAHARRKRRLCKRTNS